MQVTGTHINYYYSCKRQLWLFANGINMENSNDLVYEGKLIHETSYNQRPEKYQEIEIGSIKLDYYDAKNKVIHEVKKSSKLYQTHLWQLRYYIYILEQEGIEGVTGILEYPKERKKEEVYLSIPDREKIKTLISEIKELLSSSDIPGTINAKRCKNCSYYDFCYITENTDE